MRRLMVVLCLVAATVAAPTLTRADVGFACDAPPIMGYRIDVARCLKALQAQGKEHEETIRLQADKIRILEMRIETLKIQVENAKLGGAK